MRMPTILSNRTSHKKAAASRVRHRLPFGMALCVAGGQVGATELDWKNTATDFNAAASYTQATTAPSSTTVEFFKTAASVQPNLTATLTTAGLNFSASGYDFTPAAGKTLTLAGYGTSATGTTASAAAAIYSSATGTNTVEVPITLLPGNGTSIPTLIQTGVGGNLILSGKLSGALGFNTTITGGSTITLSGANDISGTISLTGASLTSPAILAIGNDSALGTASVTFTSGDTLAASGGAHTITNNILYGGSGGITGTNDLTLGGTFTSSGSSSRTLTVSNSGVTTLSGNVYLAPDNTTARGLIITGAGATTISGSIANNASGNTLASFLTYSGSNTLTLTGNNTYTGLTTISSGATLNAASTTGSALGATSGITITGNSTLVFGAANQLNATAPAAVSLGSYNGTTLVSTSGTIKTTGFSQGSTTAPGIGALTLVTSSTGNTVDFGGMAAVLSFAGFVPNAAVLTISNYVSAGAAGGPDELIFATDQTGNLSNFNFGSGAGVNVAEATLASGAFEVYYTISNVPEPTTVLGGTLLIGAAAWSQRRRLRSAVCA